MKKIEIKIDKKEYDDKGNITNVIRGERLVGEMKLPMFLKNGWEIVETKKAPKKEDK